ncbi:MAG: hypothetical protein IJ794_07920 [Lachnospiraceae bacterium]|nr:hypothetical protein [Lachnospiraceae bacterium]
MGHVKQKKSNQIWWEPVLLVVLFWYPLRFIHGGIDFWDTGYNYANFLYMGTEHMDSMWLFSTYLANVVGHGLTRLPGAGTLVGMNLYTGLFASALGLLGYWFATRKLGIAWWIAYLGEFAALSLCWCPTALLYNYLTYLLFTGCVILLYIGLTKEKKGCLFAAGICLGANVLVRFSNLPEAALIVAVWAYAFLEGRERKNLWTAGKLADTQEGRERRELWEVGKLANASESSAWRKGVQYTLWCLGGYLAALIVLFGWIQIRYGMDAYVEGIGRLFAMTDKATDYKAGSMVWQLIFTYVDNLYWVLRIGVIVFVGMIGFAFAGFLDDLEQGLWEKVQGEVRLIWCGVCAGMVCWLYQRGFCAVTYDNYGAILRPGISFLTLTLGICVIRILWKGVPKEEKLISGLVFLLVLLTSIGSNNGVYPSLNHLFIPAPYTIWQCMRFVQQAKRRALWAVKPAVIALLLLFLAQSAGFGFTFVFAEATGAKEMTTVIGNNEVLSGIRMSPERAQWLSEISAYVESKGMKGREVILFGNIPAMSYYLQMPSAFNPWSDLDSYNEKVMAEALGQTAEAVMAGQERPVVLLEANYARYMQGGAEALEAAGVHETVIWKIQENDGKMQLLKAYLEELQYGVTFENEKFVMME